MAKVKFNRDLVFGDTAPLKLVKTHIYEREWEKLPLEQFLQMKMEDFFDGKLRLVVECKIEEKTCRISTHQEDYDAIRQKYPNDLSVYLKQILMLWKHVPDYGEELPRVLKACAELRAVVV